MTKLNKITKKSIWVIMIFVLLSCDNQKESDKKADNSRPNILFAIADDASYPHMGAYGTDWIDTPADALVMRKDPMDFVRRWDFYAERRHEAFA